MIADPEHPDAQALAFQRGLSPWNARFLDVARTDPLYRASEPLPSFDGLPNHPWPTFVDSSRVQEWVRLSVALRRLVLGTGLSLVPTRAAELAAVFGYSAARAELVARLLADRTRHEAFASRPDFLLCADGFKCCEVDFGDAGVLHVDAVNMIFHHAPIVQDFAARTGLRIRERAPLRTAVRQMLDLVSRRGPVRECNFAIVVPDATPDEDFAAAQLQIEFACALYQAALATFGHDGAFVLERAGAVQYHGDHAAIAGRRIDLVMTQSPSLPAEAEIWADSPLAELSARGCVCAVNGPDCSLLGNKIMLALLSEAADAGALDVADTALIRATIPWSRRVTASTVEHRGQSLWLPDLLVSARDRFVLKPGEGFASDGVKIGRNTPPADWEAAVTNALASGGWIAQEAIGGAPMWLLGGDDLAPHSANFGMLVCGEAYAGTFLRLMPLAAPGDIPTIGYSFGALTGGLIEVDDSPAR